MKKSKISKNAIAIVIGLSFVLISVIFIIAQFSKNEIFKSINDGLHYALGPVGFWILTILLLLVGILIMSNKIVIKFIINKNSPSTVEKKIEVTNEELPLESPVVMNNVITPNAKEMAAANEQINIIKDETTKEDSPSEQELAQMTMNSFNNTHTLKKAHFNFEEEQNKSVAPSMNFTPQPQPQVAQPIAREENPSPINSTNVENNNIQPSMTPNIEKPNIFNELPKEPVKEEVDPLFRPQPKAVVKPPFKLPPMNLLDLHEQGNTGDENNQSCEERKEAINAIFGALHIGAQVVSYVVGPSVTRYDIQMNLDTSVNIISKYLNDISIRLGGVPCRFEPIVFGKPTSGLEIPNAVRTTVGLRESIEALPTPVGDKYLRNIPFGKNISGELVQANLQEFPHMLVAGTTGSGKSIFVHSTIMSLLMRNTPDQLKLVLVDPKKVEMTYYHDIPHLLCPTISEPRKALVALRKLVDEMERRYNLFMTNGVRDIGSFNKFANEKNLQPLPVICVFVDEYADLSDQCKELREPVVRIAQKARAAGIHLIIATQRPSVNVIDGVIKSNIATHVALMVASAVDSTTIIGQGGAEALLGNGDMLVDCSLISRSNKPRVQGCFVDTTEIMRVCDYLRENYSSEFDPNFLDLEEHKEESSSSFDEGTVTIVDKDASEDMLYDAIKSDITSKQYCSISYIQRTYGVGFPKAGRMFNKLIKDGFVSPEHDSKGSKVLIHEESSQQMGSIEQSTFVPTEESDEPTFEESLVSDESFEN